MKRVRREEDESSLELLLDTMCNTFGGVMFIAISIFVIVAGMTQIEQAGDPAEEAPSIDPVVIQQEIETIQLVMADLQEQLQLQLQELSTREQIDVEAELQKLAALKQQIKALEMQCSAANKAIATLQPLLEAAEQAREQLKKSIAQDKTLLEKYKAEIDSLKLEIQNLQTVVPVAKQITFRVMESSSKAPFFIILAGDSIYPIGPWQSYGAQDRVDDAVNSVESTIDGMRAVSCTIKPGCGIKVFSGENFSSAFTSFMSSIPSNKVPDFFIYPNAANTAYRMREIMKARRQLHGATLAEKDNEPMVYFYTKVVNYEY